MPRFIPGIVFQKEYLRSPFFYCPVAEIHRRNHFYRLVSALEMLDLSQDICCRIAARRFLLLYLKPFNSLVVFQAMPVNVSDVYFP